MREKENRKEPARYQRGWGYEEPRPKELINAVAEHLRDKRKEEAA